jgi:beta-fructofuranosidase
VQLLAFGSYLEFSIDGRVILSLADQSFHEGLLGIYLETAHLELSHVRLHRLHPPFQSDEHLVTG